MITENLQLELGLRHKPLQINRSVFRKTKKEKQKLKKEKLNHKNLLIANGLNPKKDMNVPFHLMQ